MPSSTTSISRIARTALFLSVLPFAFQACKSPLFGLGGKVDTAVPGITIGQVEEGGTTRALVNGDYVRGTIVLRGECSDDLGVSSVALSFAETGASVTIAATLDASGTKWSATIDTTAYSDGDKDFTLKVTDSAGKTTSNRFVVYFDNRPPTVMLTVPTATEGTLGAPLYGDVDIKGSVADQFGIRKVRVYLHRSSDRGVIFASPDNASIGTNSFSVRVDTRALLGASGAETGYVNVVATDRSGNENSWFYRFDEIKALNGNVGATVEEIHAVETGRAASANGIDLAEAATARFFKPEAGTLVPDMLAYSFDQNANLPIITVSNPEQGKDADQNILSKTAKAIGLVEDANGVALVEVQFRRLDASLSPWYSDANVGVAGDDLDMSGVGRVVNWNTKTLFGNYGLDQGVQALRIRATDSDGENRSSDWVEFTIDADAPDVTIVTPLAGDYLTGDPIVLTGEAHAYGTSNVGTVEVLIGSTYHAATITSGAGSPDVAWSFDLTAILMPTDGLKSLKVRVTDAPTLKQAFYNIVVTVDRTVPTTPTVTSPVRGSSVNGFPTILGSANDGVLLDAVHLVFEKNAEDVLLADTYNWNYQLDAAARANATYGYDMGNNIWRVPIRIRAVDMAGNERITPSIGGSPTTAPAAGAYYLDVDLEGDKPRIEQVISPGAENTPATAYQIPGSIKVQGTALDDDGLHHVEMELIAVIDGVTQKFCNLDGSYTAGGGATEVWHTVAGTSLWNLVLNESGELYDLEAGHGGNFLIRVRAWDTKDGGLTADVAGNVTEVYVKFDNTLPGVIDLAPAENSLVRGIFNLDFTAQDNVAVSTAQISYNNGSSYSTLVMTPAASVPFSIPVNTATINAGVFNNSAGTLYIRVKLKDNANNVTEKNLKYLVDNVPPTGDYLDSGGKLADINDTHYTEGGASLAEAIGVANDVGQVSGVSMVEVYFVRTNRVYRVDPTLAASNVAEESYAFSNGTFPYTTVPGYKIVIDDRDEQSNDSGGLGDGDHFDENLTKNASNYDWSARFDSSKIADGQVTAHYVVWDEAGNSTHYSETGKVQNNKPTLTAVVVGTDLNDNGVATDYGERVRLTNSGASSRKYVLDASGIAIDSGIAFVWATDSAITGKNNRLSITLESSGGNLPLANYLESPNGTSLLNWTAGASYTETAFGGAAGWVEDAANVITVQIRDSAWNSPISTSPVTLRVTLDNADGIPPDVAIIDDPYWTGESDNSLYASSRANGHIELVSGFNGADPDVSGQISLRGSAHDNQRINNIRMRISGFDFNDGGTAPAAGAWFTVAAWNGSTVAGSDQWATYGWRFTVDANSPVQSGHGLTWRFDWDSSRISAVAATNVLVELDVQDVSLSTTDGFQVDVVPYITAISRDIATYSTIRSRQGYYSLRQGETVTVTGFNLFQSTADTISFGSGSYTLPPGATTSAFNVGLTSTATSGPVTLTVSGVASINNTDSNAVEYNTEDSVSEPGSALWTDDRRAHVWRSDDNQTGGNRGYFTGSADPEYPAMTMDGTGVLYGSWSNYAVSDVIYGANNGTATTIFSSYDPLEHTDIHFGTRATVVYNANTYGNTTWDQAGAGGVQVWDSQAAYNSDGGTGSNYPIEELYLDQRLMQFVNERVVSSGNNIHVSYYDTDTKSLKYAYQLSNTNLNPRENKGWINIDGGYDTHDQAATVTILTQNYPGTPTISSSQVIVGSVVAPGDPIHTLSNGDIIRSTTHGTIATIRAVGLSADNQANVATITGASRIRDEVPGTTRVASAGEYSAIDVTPTNNYPVIAYYDISNQTVKIARATAVNPSAAQWNLQTVFGGADPNRQFSGKYISMRIDSLGYLHMAFFRNSTGDLVYMRSTNNPINGATAYAFGNSVTVDSIGSVGVWADMTLQNDRAYISYLDSSLTNTFNGIKVAYWDSALESETGDNATLPDTTDGWEHMNAALGYEVESVRTSVEGDMTANPNYWKLAIGYSSTDYFRIGYLVD